MISLIKILSEIKIVPNINFIFQNNPYEKAKNLKQTIYNFVKANPYLSEKQISDSLRIHYHPHYIALNLRSVPDLKRVKVPHPITKKLTYAYYV